MSIQVTFFLSTSCVGLGAKFILKELEAEMCEVSLVVVATKHHSPLKAKLKRSFQKVDGLFEVRSLSLLFEFVYNKLHSILFIKMIYFVQRH